MTLALFYAGFVLAFVLPGCTGSRSFLREDGSVDGRVVYEAKCQTCHGLYSPYSVSDGDWADIVKEMAPRAGLPPSLRKAVLDYLTEENDLAPPKPAPVPPVPRAEE